ncbi:TPA: DUF1542 domain-containing protein [Streptococcus pyogenes]|nr:DUF1542 domain-containing protein [Streptococcus pyogenes]
MFLKHQDVKQKNWRMRKVKKLFVSSCMLLTVGLGVAVPTGFSQSNGVMVVKAAEVPAAEGVFKIETDNLQNWEAETNTQGYKGTFSKSPDSQGFYKVQTNSGAGIGVQVAPKGNGRMDIKIGNRVEIPKGYYVGGIRTKTPVLEKDNTYRLSFTTSKTSGTDVEFKTRIKDVEANGDLGQEHTIKFDGNTVSTGNPWIKGLTNKKHTVDFIGKGKALSMAFRFSPFKTTNITYTFTDMNISNVTPASVPETPSSVYEEATKISGKAVASKDNFNKRTNFLGDVVNVYKLDQLVGTAQVKSGNTFEVVLNLKEPLKQGEKLEVEIQNPKSALLSARVPINVIAKPYDKAQHLKDSKASLDEAYRQTVENITQDNWLKSSEKQKQTNAAKLAYDQGIIELGRSNDKAAINSVVTKYTQKKTGLITKEHILGEKDKVITAAKNAIEEKATAEKTKIDSDNSLTTPEKEAQLAQLSTAKEAALTAITESPDADTVGTKQTEGEASVSGIHQGKDLEAIKTAAKNAIEEKATAEKTKINNDITLTAKDKEQQLKEVETALTKAKDNVKAAKTADAINDARDKGVATIDAVHKAGQDLGARKSGQVAKLEEAAKATKDKISADPTLTSKEKEEQSKAVDAELKKAIEAVNAADTADKVDDALGKGVTDIKNQHKSGKGLDVRKDEHKKALEAVAKRVTAEIEADPTLTPEVREQQKAEVQKELELATDKIAEAKDADEADKAYGDGVTAIENAHVIGKGIEARKDLAEAVAKTKALIIEDKTLTDDQRKEQLSGVDTEYAKGIENIDAAKDAAGVDKAYSDGVRDILAQYKEGQNLDDRRNAAKEFLLKEADKVTKLINDDPTLTHDQKVDQINKVEQAKLDAIKSVDDAQTADAINDALGKGIENINNQYQHGDGVDVRKATAKGDLEKEAAKVKALIAKDPTLTQADKDKQTAAVDAAKNTAIAAVDKATTAEGINQELGKGITAINKAYRPGEAVKARKEAAKADLEKEAAKVKALITNDPTLTKADKAKQTEAVAKALKAAIAAVDKATTAEGINQELGKGITAINKAYRPGEAVKARKEAAKADLEREAAKVREAIANDPTLTKADKAKQTEAVAKALKAAIAAVDKATTAEGINQELGKGITAINKAYRPGEGVKARKEAAKANLEKVAKETKALISGDRYLSETEKAVQKQAVEQALAKALGQVEAAKTVEAVKLAENLGTVAIRSAYVAGLAKDTDQATAALNEAKQAAIEALKQAAAETLAKITTDAKLTEAQKAEQSENVSLALKTAIATVRSAQSIASVKEAIDKGITAIRAAYVPNKAVAKSSSANHLPKSGDANSIVLVGLGVMSLLLGMVLYSKKKESKD